MYKYGLTKSFWKIIVNLLLSVTIITLSGCATTLGYQAFYRQVAPEKYTPAENVRIFEYSNADMNELYDLLFSDLLIVGESSFNGPYEDPGSSVSYARSIGADTLIASTQFAETRTSFMPLLTPTMSTTTISGYSGTGSFYGTATSYGTTMTSVPITINRYDQHGMYLKNVNSSNIPLWERNKQDYKKTANNRYDGLWYNENYDVELFLSGSQIVGFIGNVKKDLPDWKPGQLKMIFNPETGTGIYLMGNKTPMPANIALNKFGHLEFKLILSKERFSFARK